MGITFVGLGLPPGMGSTHWLPSIIGPQRAAELILTGTRATVSHYFCHATTILLQEQTS